jgi:peroxiredoxin
MKKLFSFLLFLLSFQLWAVESGKPAPDFSLMSETGKEVKLSDYKGKTVVLEWFNHGCPFVRKHYETNNMQNLQKKWTGKDVIWLSINSSAKGKGYLDAKGTVAEKEKNKTSSTAILIDETGKVGKLYEAKTTPHMFIINKDGVLVYQGAIDSLSSADKEDVPKAKNYVDEILTAMSSGKTVKFTSNQPYGCGVKY